MQIRNLSLKMKIVGSMTILVVLVAVFVFVYFPSRQNAQAERTKDVEVNGIAQILSQAIVAGLEFEDIDTVERVLAGVKERKDLISLEVLKPSGDTFYQFDAVIEGDKSAFKTGHNFVATAPVISGDDTIGELKLNVSLEDLEKQKAANRQAVMLAALVIIILGVVFGLYLSHLVLTPLSHIHAILKKIAEGDGDLTQRIEIENDDEIGALSQSFNQFLGNLGSLIGNVKESTEKVANVVEQISAISSQTATGAETQTTQTSEVAASVQQMTTAIMVNSKNATQTSEIAERAAQQAQDGSQSMLITKSGMDKIVDATVNTGGIINSLSDRADEIGKIIQVINDIADQTNLLALNAAIEAARAGEQGRGFAVVADEVRKLAERTMKATGEIGQTIQAIQSGAGQAADSMNEAHTAVGNGREATDKTESVLSEIVLSVTQAMDMVTQIAAASEEMSSGAEEISRNVETISMVARESSTGADQMAQVAINLTDETGTLRELMSRFKLD